jgi:aromatic-L-amino-acid decarboxylase
MLWKTSPACTELERVVLLWYAEALGLPTHWFGMMTDTASTSTLMALAAAREAALPGLRDEGLSGKPPLVLYCSEEAHSSVDKAAMVLGVGRNGVRHIPADDEFRMLPDALIRAIQEDRRAGRLPFAVVATVGTTSATAVDPVPQIADICRHERLWLHVDTAYAGSAAVAPELRWALAGCEHADSLTCNPHKWFFTTLDCSTIYTRRPEDLRRAFSLVPEYLRTDAGEVTDLMNYTFQLGRRFRALKLWFVFRYFGTEGIASLIRGHVALAKEFASWVDANPRMERLAPVPFSVVCFRVLPPGVRSAKGPFDEKLEAEIERLNGAILQKVNAHGDIFVTHTKLKGRYCIRVAIGNLNTKVEHLRRAFDLIASTADANR